MIDPEAGRSTGRPKGFFKVPYFASLDSRAMKDASSASTCRGARVTRLRRSALGLGREPCGF